MAAAGAALLAAAGASATVVQVEVINEAAPRVRIVSPAHGARLPAGVAVTVVVEGGDSDRLALAVNGVDTWQVPGDHMEGRWTPQPGRHRFVAVASREGAPDAVALAVVVAEEPARAPAVPVTPPPPDDAAPPSAPVVAAQPGLPRPSTDPGPADRATASHPRSRPAPAPAGFSAPTTRRSAAAAADAAGPRPRADDGWRWALGRIVEFLTSPEKVAWTVAFPLLLLIAAGAYALLQRFIDGGPKLAWRGRGDADDSVIEF